MCKIKINCKYWDEAKQRWSTEGVNTTLSADGTSVACATSHLTTFGGIIDVPASSEELMKELSAAFTFQAFTMDEAFELLSNFSIGDNMTIVLVIAILIGSDILCLSILGVYKGRRARLRREAKGEPFADEQVLKELAKWRKQLRAVHAKRLVVEKLDEGSLFGGGRDETRSRLRTGRLRQQQLSFANRFKANASKNKVRRGLFRGKSTRTQNEAAPPAAAPAGEVTINGMTLANLKALRSMRVAAQQETKALTAVGLPSSRASARIMPFGTSKSRFAAMASRATAAHPSEPNPSPTSKLAASALRMRATAARTSELDASPTLIRPVRASPALVSMPSPPPSPPGKRMGLVGAKKKMAVLRELEELRKQAAEKQRQKLAMDGEGGEAEEEKDGQEQEDEDETCAKVCCPPPPRPMLPVRMCNGVVWWLRDGSSRIIETARNEHTVVNLLWTPDDEDALTPPQMMHLFWTALSVELFVICFQYNGPLNEEDPAKGGGRRGGAAAGSSIAEGNELTVSTFAIQPVTALTQGVIASGICMASLTVFAYVFRWGNNRHRRVGDNGGWVVRMRQVRRLALRTFRKTRRRMRRRWIKHSRRAVSAWEEEKMRKEEEAEAWAEARDAEPMEEKPPPGMEYVTEKKMNFIGTLCCLLFPGIGLLAFCLCMRKRRVLVSVPGEEGEFPGLGFSAEEEEAPADAAPWPAVAIPMDAESVNAAIRMQAARRKQQAARELARRAEDELELEQLDGAAEMVQRSFRRMQGRRQYTVLKAVILLQRGVRRRRRNAMSSHTEVMPWDSVGLPESPGGGKQPTDGAAAVSSDPQQLAVEHLDDVSPPPSPPEGERSPRGTRALTAWGTPTQKAQPSPAGRITWDRDSFSGPQTCGCKDASASGSEQKEATSKLAALLKRDGGAKATLAMLGPPTTTATTSTAAGRKQLVRGAASRMSLKWAPTRIPNLRELASGRIKKENVEFLSKDLMAVVIEARIQQRIDDIGWRDDREFFIRRTIAWIVNVSAMLFTLFVSFIYALKFGEYTMAKALVSWAIAYGWTFLLVEPFQVFFLAFSPCLFDEDTRCGRNMVRCRTIYNELCAP